MFPSDRPLIDPSPAGDREFKRLWYSDNSGHRHALMDKLSRAWTAPTCNVRPMDIDVFCQALVDEGVAGQYVPPDSRTGTPTLGQFIEQRIKKGGIRGGLDVKIVVPNRWSLELWIVMVGYNMDTTPFSPEGVTNAHVTWRHVYRVVPHTNDGADFLDAIEPALRTVVRMMEGSNDTL